MTPHSKSSTKIRGTPRTYVRRSRSKKREVMTVTFRVCKVRPLSPDLQGLCVPV
jgi:hypothetical protein